MEEYLANTENDTTNITHISTNSPIKKTKSKI